MADGPFSPAAVPPAFTQPAPTAPVDLRSLTTSELIDRGFSLYRAHFAGFLLLALLCQSAPLVGQILVTALKLNPTQNEIVDVHGAFFLKMAALIAISLVAQIIGFCFQVVITFYTSDAYLGKIPSVKESLRQFTTRFLSSLWTCVLNRIVIGLTFFFPMIALAAIYFYGLFYPPLTFLPLLAFGTAAVLLLVASLAPVLIVFMRLMVTLPALALEGRSGWKAIRRSSALVRYDPGLGILYWGEMRLSFLLLPLFIIELLILSLTSLPLTLHQVGEIMRHGSSGQIAPPPDSILILSQILTFLAGSLILPLYAIATTLFYYDIRIRREGFDLEFMARQLGGRK
ncbi:MAG: hypothetical protein LV480_04580 [Methylacidiphilales bacterium]|nr:hypothetical protein [Candidatus Methylacidiphilales bacterium]